MEFVKTYIHERIGYISLNRAEKRNALNFQFTSELKEAFKSFSENTAVKIIVLKAEGPIWRDICRVRWFRRSRLR